MLERLSGEKRGILPRLCYDVIREAVASKKYSALQKAHIRAFVATEAFLLERERESCQLRLHRGQLLPLLRGP